MLAPTAYCLQSMERNSQNGLHTQLKFQLDRFLNGLVNNFSQSYSCVARVNLLMKLK